MYYSVRVISNFYKLQMPLENLAKVLGPTVVSGGGGGVMKFTRITQSEATDQFLDVERYNQILLKLLQLENVIL